MTKIEKRFWSKVYIKHDEACWEWSKGVNGSGYGEFWVTDRNIRAHRFAWESHHNRKVPEGKWVLHKCDNKRCCNPLHLFIGDRSDNIQDVLNKSRGNKHKVAFKLTKVSADQILQVRDLLKTKLSQDGIAGILKIPQATVSRINRSKEYPCKEGFYI
jgi:hypothetical protein